MPLRTSAQLGALSVNTNQTYSAMQQNAISRNIIPVENLLAIDQQTYEFDRRIDNYNAKSSPDGEKFGINKSQFSTELKNINTLATSFAFTKNQLARINRSSDPINAKLSRVASNIAQDEDINAIAGSGKTGTHEMKGLGDSTNTTSATTQLDLSDFDSLRSTLNEIINDLNSNAKKLSTGSFTQSNQITVLMTQDVENRLEVLTGSNSDTIVGADIMREILGRRAPSYSIYTTDLLGATAVSIDDVAVVEDGSEGELGFMMFSRNPAHRKIVTSPFETTQETYHGDLSVRISEKFGIGTIEPLSSIYSDTVVLTS